MGTIKRAPSRDENVLLMKKFTQKSERSMKLALSASNHGGAEAKQRIKDVSKMAEDAMLQPSPRKMINSTGQVIDVKRLPKLSFSERSASSSDGSSAFGGEEEDQNERKKHTKAESTTYSSSTLDEAEQKYFARSENRSVRNLKALVLLVLLSVAAAVCFAVYFLTDRGQQDEFEASFAGSAAKVVKSFEDVLEQKIASIASFGVTMTAFALETNSTWPFVTLNKFQQRCASSRSLSGSLYHVVLPLVAEEQRLDWEAYSLANTDWIFEAREDESLQEAFHYLEAEDQGGIRHNHVISEKIYDFDFDKIAIEVDEGPGPYAPLWQSSPVLPWPRDLVNYNAFHHPTYSPFGKAAFETGLISLGLLDTGPPGGMDHPSVNTFIFAHLLSAEAKKNTNYTGEPFSSIFIPIMDTLDVMKENRKPVALLVSIIRWATYFENILTDEDSDRPLHVVLSNSCQEPVTYEIRGTSATYLGVGNRADSKYHDLMVQTDLDGSKLVIEPDTIALTVNQELCNYTLRVYPTQQGDDYYNDNFPLFITLIVAAVFVFTMGVFVVYDSMVEKRQRKVLDTAKRSTAIVSSMFPRKVRDQLLQAPVQGNATKLRYFANEKKASGGESPFQVAPGLESNSKPIADLFPDCTVMFADVEGFTAWSSVREPSQVFTFLEGIYSAFDAVAARRVVFKVETVGDCYVAVCGLPDPRDNHAVVMARFACDCITQHIETVRKLELTLGPETGDLRIRIGLHSGPITAGVLRGERSRFQIFGDTVNTAARLESSGQGNAIHLSAATARLIKDAGHGAWIQAREDAVHLKGKGTLSTFWLTMNRNDLSLSSRTSNSTSCQRSINSTTSDTVVDFRKERLVAWNAEILIKLLKQVIASRDGKSKRHTPPTWKDPGTNPLEEVIEIIPLPNQKSKRSTKKRVRDPTTIEIELSIIELVHNYVAQLASMYHDNHFHNFEHASHVTMSVAKLLSRIVAPSDMDFMDGAQAETKLHDHTYGITSDPLTQFACVLSALIHDADHQGVSNTTLVEEGDDLTQLYGTKSLAEQNSVDRAWDLLMSPRFRPLIAVLCRGDAELKRLRQLVVNSVMATDIMDPDLKTLRNARWDKAFKKSEDCNDEDTSSEKAINRKATIVIEHLIQASDVSHTMQHWNVYTKWNARLFKEMYKAYIEGRAGAKDPSVFWAKGEIGFFDFYIIPLAKKLKDCGVFGVSSDEYLQYAISNRNEWEAKGEMMVQRLIAEVHQEFGTSLSVQRKF